MVFKLPLLTILEHRKKEEQVEKPKLLELRKEKSWVKFGTLTKKDFDLLIVFGNLTK